MAGPQPASDQESTTGRSPGFGEEAARKSTPGVFSGPLGVALFLVLFGTAVYLSYRTLTAPEPVKPTPISREFYCIEAKKPFEHAMDVGERLVDDKGVLHPVLSPYSKKNTGYPVEKCYWTRDGKRKAEPTYVILNEYLGKTGDTICPDCGRIVVGHNPRPPESVPPADGK